MVEIIIPEVVEWNIGIVKGKQDRIIYLKSPTVAGLFLAVHQIKNLKDIKIMNDCVEIK